MAVERQSDGLPGLMADGERPSERAAPPAAAVAAPAPAAAPPAAAAQQAPSASTAATAPVASTAQKPAARGATSWEAVIVPSASPAQTAAPAAPRRVRSVSVVVPAKDERKNLPALLAELQPVLAAADLAFAEIVVVDDGSTDGTGELAAARGARVVRHAESLGNGAAVKRGIREAKGEWILLLDGDGQHPPAAIPSLLKLAERYDMVVGSRGGRGGRSHRNFANRVYNALASYVSGKRIPDLTSGYRLLRADLAKDLVWLLPNTFSYPTTLTLSLLRGGYGVAFQPIEVRPRQGRSHVRLLADGSRFFLIILRIATMFAPLRVFLPLSLGFASLGVGWYLWTWFTEGRFTNMGVLLLCQATIVFVLGLISEQVAALRFQQIHRDSDRA